MWAYWSVLPEALGDPGGFVHGESLRGELGKRTLCELEKNKKSMVISGS